jgi:hypothetical protein
MPSYSKSQFEKAIEGSGGVISTVARKVGCEWATAQSWIDKCPGLQSLIDAERLRVTDIAKSHIVRAIHQGNIPICKWWLTMYDRQDADENSQITTVIKIGGLDLDDDI